MQIKALWIDDLPNKAFIDEAEGLGIYVEVRGNVDAGIDEFLHSSTSYDAIILDANCISHNDGSTDPDISALGYALRMITENKINVPWFVYSAGGFSGEESINITVRAYERLYDKKGWYRKTSERHQLFAKIKKVVPEWANYIIKEKYSQIFSFYPNAKELHKIILFIEEKKYNDPDVFNLIRKELDWVMEYLYNCGLLKEPYKGSNLNECSTYLGQKELESIVPVHIQRSFHSTSVICNDGSHRLVVDKLVKEGRAPYLIKSTIYEFLNILVWLKDMPTDTKAREELKKRVEVLLKRDAPCIEDYEGKDFVVEQDEKGNYHCGQCRLSYQVANNYKDIVGKTATLFDVTYNRAKSKDNYQLYVGRFKIKD